MKKLIQLVSQIAAILFVAAPAFAEEAAVHAGGLVAIGSGVAIGIAAAGASMGQGRAVGAALESIGRNPSAAGKVQTPMVLGLVFMETLVIFSFVIALFLSNKV